MSEDLENRERIFNENIGAVFGELATGLAVDIDRIRSIIVAAFRSDLIGFDSKARLLDDIIAIVEIGDADAAPGDKYRKIRQALAAKGLVEN